MCIVGVFLVYVKQQNDSLNMCAFLSWAASDEPELLEGSIHIHTSSASHCFCVCGTLGPPAALAGIVWLCCVCVCVCVWERECEKKSRGKKRKKKRKEASVPSGTNMGLVVQLTHKCWLESRISDTPKKTKMWCHDVDFKLRKWVSNFNDQNQK